MRVNYEKPSITIEEYQLDTAIAANCTTIVLLGPTPGDYNGNHYDTCYPKEVFAFDTFAVPQYGNFFDKNCSCYLTAADTTVFTS